MPSSAHRYSGTNVRGIPVDEGSADEGVTVDGKRDVVGGGRPGPVVGGLVGEGVVSAGRLETVPLVGNCDCDEVPDVWLS